MVRDEIDGGVEWLLLGIPSVSWAASPTRDAYFEPTFRRADES